MKLFVQLDNGTTILREVDTFSWYSPKGDVLEARDATGRTLFVVPHGHIVSVEVLDPEPTQSEEEDE